MFLAPGLLSIAFGIQFCGSAPLDHRSCFSLGSMWIKKDA